MNQFDIMISTYGSHLVNILFTLSPNTAVIEVAEPVSILNEFPMMTHYFRSFGHMPVGDPSLLISWNAAHRWLIAAVHLMTHLPNGGSL